MPRTYSTAVEAVQSVSGSAGAVTREKLAYQAVVDAMARGVHVPDIGKPRPRRRVKRRESGVAQCRPCGHLVDLDTLVDRKKHRGCYDAEASHWAAFGHVWIEVIEVDEEGEEVKAASEELAA